MKADKFLNILLENGFGPFTGVPCSLVNDLIYCAENSKETRYYSATSEGEAMGIAAGFSLSGKLPVVILQNDGFGNAVNPLTSLQLLYELPVLIIITWRGEPGGKPDAPQHRIMGEILLGLMTLLKIPYSILQDDETAIREDIQTAKKYLIDEKKPYACVVRQDFFESSAGAGDCGVTATDEPIRIDYIRALAKELRDDDVVLATTGYTGREMFQEIRKSARFYMAGSMGCAPSVGFGIALEHPDRNVYILDGDGALLMKLGTLATIGHYKPRNLVHIVFDNGVYESTGGQKTVSTTVNFQDLALNSGYQDAQSVKTLEKFSQFIKTNRDRKGPIMCHVKIKPGTVKGLVRPSRSCPELKEDFINCLKKSRQVT